MMFSYISSGKHRSLFESNLTEAEQIIKIISQLHFKPTGDSVFYIVEFRFMCWPVNNITFTSFDIKKKIKPGSQTITNQHEKKESYMNSGLSSYKKGLLMISVKGGWRFPQQWTHHGTKTNVSGSAIPRQPAANASYQITSESREAALLVFLSIIIKDA